MTVLWCWQCQYSWVQFANGNLLRPARALCGHRKYMIGG